MDLNRNDLEDMIKEILTQKLCSLEISKGEHLKSFAGNIIKVRLPEMAVEPKDRLDTGDPGHRVYTKDIFSLEESGRLGCGIMEMEHTTFDWTLNYDELDYVIEGSLTIIMDGKSVTAGPGEVILIPRGSSIQFSVLQSARFLYVTYPADWASQK